jgi:phosphotransferase system enzyme I (PtsI)
MRRELHGHGASRGSALGRARLRIPDVFEVAEERVEDTEAELARLHAAIAVVRTEMQALRERLQGVLVAEAGDFLDLHALLLDDPELLHGLDQLVREERYSADYALRVQRNRIAAVFEHMDDAYLRSRIDDIDQVIGRLHAALHRDGTGVVASVRGVAGEILVTDNVAPTELLQWHGQGVMAVVTTGGSHLSHSAILARSLHLPFVVGATGALQKINEGDVLAVDGASGLVVVEPGPEDLRAHRARLRELARERKQLNRLRRVPSRTMDGVDIRLWANAESREDVAEAHKLGAAGVGLYRTEFLFLGSTELPDEEAQFRAYRDLVLGMTGRTTTIRTLDLGADKADRTGLVLDDEPNPALGVRGVRLSLSRRELFATQLRAIARASGYGPVRVLVPMVASREEVVEVRGLLRTAMDEARAAGHEVADAIPVGAMIEVPAAAIALPGFVDDLDFLSIGTNDLVQYLLAVDRNNDALAEMYSPLHPAVVRVLHDVIRLGRARGKPVAVCGEMAADALFAPMLLALGLEEFSLHPSTLLEVRRAIRACHLGELRARVPALLRARDRAGIEAWMRKAAPKTDGNEAIMAP